MSMTVQQIIDVLIGAVHRQGTAPVPDTVDTLKGGKPDMVVTGVATCFLATQDVLQRAVRLHCNFVITHEPVFYNHRDAITWQSEDPVYAAKIKYIADNGLAVFRYHDYWHLINPDGILEGMVQKLGWSAHRLGPASCFFSLPTPTPVRAVAQELKSRLGIATVRVAGNPDRAVTKLCLHPGWGNHTNLPQRFNQNDTELLIIGESPEWETAEYVRDAVTQGSNKALLVLGHADSEEAGMEYLNDWLKPQLPEAVPLHYVPSRNPFLFV